MYLIINVGSTGTGKSTLVNKEFVDKGRKVFIFDQQNEYSQLAWYDKAAIKDQMRFFGSMEDFYAAWKTLSKGYTIVVEEATGIYSGRVSKEVITFILSKRHIKMNFVCNFHFMHSVPKNLMSFADLLYIRKTGDFEMDVKKKFPQYLETWREINASSDPYEHRMIKVSNLTK